MTRRKASAVALAGLAGCARRRRELSAAEFWDAYFRQRYATLRRSAQGWDGEVRRPTTKDLTKEVETDPVAISRNTLLSYDYASDPRFSLPERLALSTGDAIRAVIDKSYPYFDSPPFAPERLSEVFAALKPDAALDPRPLLTQPQPAAAVIWLLGERRDPANASVLLEILQRADLHFTVEDAAFTALAKLNDASHRDDLLSLMNGASGSRRAKIARLFEYQCSSTELLSLAKLGDSYMNPAYWASIPPASPGRSLFWEFRYLSGPRSARSDKRFAEICAG